MSTPLLPSGIRPGDGLGDFIAFTTDGGYRAAAATHGYDDENETYRRQKSWGENGADRFDGSRPARESRERGR